MTPMRSKGAEQMVLPEWTRDVAAAIQSGLTLTQDTGALGEITDRSEWCGRGERSLDDVRATHRRLLEEAARVLAITHVVRARYHAGALDRLARKRSRTRLHAINQMTGLRRCLPSNRQRRHRAVRAGKQRHAGRYERERRPLVPLIPKPVQKLSAQHLANRAGAGCE